MNIRCTCRGASVSGDDATLAVHTRVARERYRTRIQDDVRVLSVYEETFFYERCARVTSLTDLFVHLSKIDNFNYGGAAFT